MTMWSNRLSIKREVVFISLLAILVGLGAKAVRQKDIPFWGSPPIVRLLDLPKAIAEPSVVHPDSLFVPSEVPYRVSLMRTVLLHQQKQKLPIYFIDARSPDLYSEGHITGALNLPFEQLDEYHGEVVPSLDMQGLIVIYCDNEDCPLSLELAEALLAEGFRRIAVFEGGWDEWVDSGCPTATELESAE